MTNKSISIVIAEYLNKMMDYRVRATPKASNAPMYGLDNGSCEILLWVDNNPNYSSELGIMENHQFMPYPSIKKSYRIIISIAYRGSEEDSEIDEIIDELETHLTNLKLDKCAPLMPRPNTPTQTDANGVQWKQAFYETAAFYRIDLHTTED